MMKAHWTVQPEVLTNHGMVSLAAVVADDGPSTCHGLVGCCSWNMLWHVGLVPGLLPILGWLWLVLLWAVLWQRLVCSTWSSSTVR